MQQDTRERNPLGKLIGWSIFLFLLLTALYAGAVIWLALSQGSQRGQILSLIVANTATIGSAAWSFARPLLQLSIILLIVDWLIGRFGLRGRLPIQWNTQTIIAVIVIGAVAIAALADPERGLDILKDLALVVVGFYFGTQRKMADIDLETGKEHFEVEHINPVSTPPPTTQKPQA